MLLKFNFINYSKLQKVDSQVVCFSDDESDDQSFGPPLKKSKFDELISEDEEEKVSAHENSYISPSKIPPQEECQIAGIPVKFPVKPYPCQIALVNKVRLFLKYLFYII